MIADGAAAFASHGFSSDVGVYLHRGKSVRLVTVRRCPKGPSCAGIFQAAVGLPLSAYTVRVKRVVASFFWPPNRVDGNRFTTDCHSNGNIYIWKQK
jgi:hypothetical protein